MEISGINQNGLIKINQNPLQKVDTEKNTTSFANVIQGYLKNVDHTVKEASDLSVKLAAGQIDNIHDVTIASQKSKLALELTVAIRDKAVEAYQETMRMQI
jgi:flagellar hook-basal body complex protein FliE